MRRVALAVVMLALAATLVLSVGLYAQIKKDKESGLDRIEGMVQSYQKDKSTFSLKQSGGTSVWQVAVNTKTAFTLRNKPGKVEDMKDGIRVVVLGKYENNVMTAVRVDIRAGM